jgi:hypothetical protein
MKTSLRSGRPSIHVRKPVSSIFVDKWTAGVLPLFVACFIIFIVPRSFVMKRGGPKCSPQQQLTVG